MNYKTMSLDSVYKDELMIKIRMWIKSGWEQMGQIVSKGGRYSVTMVKR